VGNKLKNFFRVESLIPNVFVPTLTLAMYCGVIGLTLNYYQLIGVTHKFVFKILEKSLPVILSEVVIIIPLFIYKQMKKGKWFSFTQKISTISSGDLIIILLPLTPIVQYIINNVNILSISEILIVFSFFFFSSGLVIYVIPGLLSIVGNLHVLLALGTALAFTIAIMPLLSQNFHWFMGGDFNIQILIFLALFVLIFILNNKRSKKILYLFIIMNFLVSNAIQLLPQRTVTEKRDQLLTLENNNLYSVVNRRIPEFTPDVYLLVYESYVPNETLLAYGINNQIQEDYLRRNDFKIYPNIYSVGSPTINSLSRLFNVSIDYLGDERRGIAGDGVVQNLFKNLGYKTYGIVTSTWIFRGYGSMYDSSYPKVKEVNMDSDDLLISAISIGEFRSDLIFDIPSYEDFVQEKQTFLENKLVSNGFYYFHSGYPGHSQNSGACRANEIEIYSQNLELANIEMQEDIGILVEKHPDAIIIIAGDHGPYLTKSCIGTSKDYDISEISRLDIQDRFATFLAIRWPTDDYEKFDDIIVLQDIFPAVFAYIFDDISIFESKIDPEILDTSLISGVNVKNGTIYGGIDDNEPLFLHSN